MRNQLERAVENRKQENIDRKKQNVESSKRQLELIIDKKLQTSFIGAISAIEEEFGALWGDGKRELTQEEKKWLDKWNRVRNRILNNGNNQIRGIRNELK